MFEFPAKAMGEPLAADDRLLTEVYDEVSEGAGIERYLRHRTSRLLERILNALLDFEGDRCCCAQRYERSPFRTAKRSGFYTRRLNTRFANLTLRIPKLRTLSFRANILARFRRREDSVLLILGELILLGPSASRFELLRKILWGIRASVKTASELDRVFAAQMATLIYDEVREEYVKVFIKKMSLDGFLVAGQGSLKLLVAIGLKEDGTRSPIGVARIDNPDTLGERWLMIQLNHLDYIPEISSPFTRGC